MTPRIVHLTEKKLVGMRVSMSFADNKTGQLWQRFMPKRKEITNNISGDLISMQVYPPAFDFSPPAQFEKWAAVEVTDFDHVFRNICGVRLQRFEQRHSNLSIYFHGLVAEIFLQARQSSTLRSTGREVQKRQSGFGGGDLDSGQGEELNHLPRIEPF